ncbi:hypothetical protein Scep_017817 [Stephania cephalantha]|uniref:Type 2 DNA topoisomerase 6 subunit B-like n=1 Tax=Stephania cephalantha TaxID=152367 RepID=A0AAP0NVA4_9MAGN
MSSSSSSSSSSIQKLCRNLIGSAVQRCRMSESLCRLSVLVKQSVESDRPMVRITISDTGIRSCLDFKQYIAYLFVYFLADGVLTVLTTGLSDEEIYQYCLNLKEHVPSRRSTRLPSRSKHGQKFSGTEITLCTYESINNLVAGFTCFLQKMLILKIPKVAVELVVDPANFSGTRCDNLFIVGEDIFFSSTESNIECLVSGFKDYVLKHGNTLDKQCQSCFSNSCVNDYDLIKTGTACDSESLRNIEEVVEAVIIMTELPESPSPSCLRASSVATRVFYFQNFLLCPISSSLLSSLASIDWKSFGLNVKSSAIDEDGHAVLEWENLPPYSHIYIAIHLHRRIQFGRNLIKRAVKTAMDDLKEKYEGTLLSSHALKIKNYAPDLAHTIAGLILSSNDVHFQAECMSFLQLPPYETFDKKVEDCIREKIITAIQMNDRNPQRSHETAPFLFEGESSVELELEEDEVEEGSDSWDL